MICDFRIVQTSAKVSLNTGELHLLDLICRMYFVKSIVILESELNVLGLEVHFFAHHQFGCALSYIQSSVVKGELAQM